MYNNQEFVRKVLDNSESEVYHVAKREWIVEKCEVAGEDDSELETTCICGHVGLSLLYTIKNCITGYELSPVGKDCIKKFMPDLVLQIEIIERMQKLNEAIEKDKDIVLTSRYFSRKFIEYLWEKEVFKGDDDKNDRDYDFIMRKFNKRKKDEITDLEANCIEEIIDKKIKPYVVEQFAIQKE